MLVIYHSDNIAVNSFVIFFIDFSDNIAYNDSKRKECVYMTLGKQIKKLRQDKGLTQAQLGYLVNKGESTVRTWELDRSQPSPQTIRLLCDILGTTPNTLLGKEEKEEPVEMVAIDNNILGKRLRAARGNMSIREFAKKCNISPPQLMQKD